MVVVEEGCIPGVEQGSTMSGPRPLTVALLVVVLATSVALPGGAAPPTSDPPTAADYAAGWLATQVAEDGSVPGGFDPLADAGNAALAFAAAGVGGEAFEDVVGHVRENIDAFVAYPFDASLDDPARLGKAIMIAVAAGEDPRSFGGTDLVARLEATLGLFAPGLYGGADPSFDGVFRQGFAVVGLVAAGVVPDPAAVAWLVDQQCGPENPEAAGGWQEYRPDTGLPCTDPDPLSFTGPDTNGTALALMALEAVGEAPGTDPLGFLEAALESDGGWGFIPGSGSDPSSTALVIRALLAMGVDPADFDVAGGDPWASLLSWQLGCDSPAEQRGAFTFGWADPPGAPDLFSTLDAIGAAAGAPYPITGEVELDPGAPLVDCSPDAPAASTSTETTVTGPPGSAPAIPVGAAPAFTG